MDKREKLLKVIDALINQHERMYDGHKARKADRVREAILEADRMTLDRLGIDYKKAMNSVDIESLYSHYEKQINLRNI